VHPAAQAAWWSAVQDGWADPSRLYRGARRARLLLDAARESVAAILGARPDEVSFPASGTAAVHLGLQGLVRGRERVGGRVAVSAVEHSSVLRAAESCAARVDLVAVDVHGRVEPSSLADALAEPGLALIAVQSANHEVGTRQPLAEVAGLARAAGVPLLVDAAQSIGREPVPEGWSVLTASAHKWGGPPGVGVLAVRTGTRWRSPSPRDPREHGRVPGFVDVPGVVAAAAALEAVSRVRDDEAARLRALVERLHREIPTRVPDTVVLGHPVERLPHVVTFSFLYVEGEALLRDLDLAGLAVSSGSSCVADTATPSHVLAAMGALTQGNLRVSLPHGAAEDDVERLIEVLPGVVARIRASLGAEGL
jgi:cysteine desulfurase